MTKCGLVAHDSLGRKLAPNPTYSFKGNVENRLYEEKQMTASSLSMTGASSSRDRAWSQIDWQQAQSQVRRLQMRIAKAVRERKWGKVKSLQWILTHSHHAKLLAVKRVSQSSGAKSPGIDGVLWRTAEQKICAASSLQRRGYKARPVRRIYILKKNGKQRPLGIPTLLDRAMQALHLLALEPIAETTAC